MTEHDINSESLKSLLQRSGIKQKDIAKKAKVSPAAVSLVADGKSKSKRIEALIREEAAKVLNETQPAM